MLVEGLEGKMSKIIADMRTLEKENAKVVQQHKLATDRIQVLTNKNTDLTWKISDLKKDIDTSRFKLNEFNSQFVTLAEH